MFKLPIAQLETGSTSQTDSDGYTSTEDNVYVANQTLQSPRVGISPRYSPRVHLLEAKVVLHQRQLARIDDASLKTAEVLTLLNQDINEVKESTQTSLQSLQDQITEARASDSEHLDAEFARIADLITAAGDQAKDAQMVANAANADVGSLALQVQALKLGLECVESSMDDTDIRDALESLRSRMEDLDANVEKTSAADASRIGDFRAALTSLTTDVQESKAAVQTMQELIETIKEDVEVTKAKVQENELQQTPPESPERNAGFERLRTALSTLSNSHNSLLQALTLVHKSQHELSARVSEVGRRAITGREVDTKKSAQMKKNNKNASKVNGHRIQNETEFKPDDPRIQTQTPKTVDDEINALKAIVAVQAQELSSQARKMENLEGEVDFLKSLFMGLVKPSSTPEGSSATIVNSHKEAVC